MHAWRIFTSSQHTHTQAYHFTLAESVSASRAHAQHKHHRSRIVCSSATPTIKQSEINALWDCARHRRACQTKMSFHIQMFILNLIFVSFESEAGSTAHIDKSLRVIRSCCVASSHALRFAFSVVALFVSWFSTFQNSRHSTNTGCQVQYVQLRVQLDIMTEYGYSMLYAKAILQSKSNIFIAAIYLGNWISTQRLRARYIFLRNALLLRETGIYQRPTVTNKLSR